VAQNWVRANRADLECRPIHKQSKMCVFVK